MRLAIVLVTVLAVGAGYPASDAGIDPFAFFRPWIAIDAQSVERLDRGDVIVRILPAEHDQIGVVAATAVDVSAEVFVERIRAVEDFYQSRYVRAIRRFSDPPQLEDLSALRFETRDLASLNQCDEDGCGIKLTAAEIRLFQRVIRTAGAGWRDAVQQPFRQSVLERVERYRAEGFAGLPFYNQRGTLVSPYEVFATLRRHSPYLTHRAPGLSALLEQPWGTVHQGVESILFWSTVQYDGKPVVTVTDVSISRMREPPPMPSVLVVSRQVLATHYMNGALAVTAFIRRDTGRGGYLVYANRTELDMLGGLFGPLKRAILESRIKAEGARLLRATRSRLEAVSVTSTPR